MPYGEPTTFWGKLRRDPLTGSVVEWHPLPHHCADVAACAEALLRGTLLGPRLAHLGGLSALADAQVARLCVLAALHDLGKFAIAFQNKRLVAPSHPTRGHLKEALGLFNDGYRFAALASSALALEQIAGWAEDMDGLLYATISHHGRPVQPEANMRPEWWAPTADLDPFPGLAALIQDTRGWFPMAWWSDAEPLPARPAFQHAWAGLLNLADWIGSDAERFFPFSQDPDVDRMPFARAAAATAIERLGLLVTPFRGAMESPVDYRRLLDGAAPRPAQRCMASLDLSPAGTLTVLEAPTGSGKTEAALLHFLRLFQQGLVDGLYFALPLRAAAMQIYQRVCRAVNCVFPRGPRPPVILAVPGYRRVDDVEGTALPDFRTYWPADDDLMLRYHGWAAENPKRFLAGTVVVGTVDQVLLSSLTVSHAHLRAAALLRQLLVVDEVHASDVYMARLLEDVLERHLGAAGHALLMSATLGSSAQHRLLATVGGKSRAAPPALAEALRRPYPLVTIASGSQAESLTVEDTGPPKALTFEPRPFLDHPVEVAARALSAAREGGRVLVIRNTVTGCRSVQDEIELLAQSTHDEHLLFRCDGVVAPHHSRYSSSDRRRLDDAIEKAFGRQRPVGSGLVAVTTQTVEQSLDLDADFMLTDLCPMDVLLQRVGRLHRHQRGRPPGCQAARVVVLVPDEGDLSGFITASGAGAGRHGLGRVYEDLRMLQASWELLTQEGAVTLPTANRRLVESATHPEALGQVVAGRGEVWRAHERWLTGVRLANRGLASLNLIPRDRPFAGLRFPDDRQVPTRLGEQDRLAQFAPPVTGPFGVEFSEMAIPYYLAAEDTPADLTDAADVSVGDGVVHFTYGGVAFVYDRLGLRRAEAP